MIEQYCSDCVLGRDPEGNKVTQHEKKHTG